LRRLARLRDPTVDCGADQMSLLRSCAEYFYGVTIKISLLRSWQDPGIARMAELEEDTVVFTTDTDFRLYRRNGRQVIPLIIPQ
jgi:hypothetical protein